MSYEKVRDRFDNYACVYDDFAPRVVPKYLEQHEVMLSLIPFERDRALSVLDLGSGTGVLSHMVLENFPRARVVAVDLADKMLEACRSNLSRYGGRLTVKKANFATDDLGAGYDLIVSGLAIHHLGDEEKQKLFRRVLDALAPGGAVLIRDVVLGATPRLTEQYRAEWRRFMRSNGEDDEVWISRHLEEDTPASAEDQTRWLEEAGFSDVGCHWRHMNFAIFGGRKPG